MHKPDPDEYAKILAAEAIGAGDATAWFERLYSRAEAGKAEVPWDRGEPHRLLVEWVKERGLRGDGRRALVIGCGLGDDAEFIAGLGFETVAFDISASAIRTARRRYPLTTVDYVTANLLDPPAAWQQAFDLVVESLTLQSLPDPPRATAIRNIGPMAAPDGTLIVNARARDEHDDPGDGPPWPLTRAEIDAIGEGVLEPVLIEDLRDTGARRWRAEFRHPDPGNPGG
ncbi:MAG TPA: methyltransferase [Streptosporangiaceae bacterium]|jgi:SAM-dependent methyltransferase